MAEHSPGFRIAIIGMACRFPGADTCEQFWANLAEGVESIRPYSLDELRSQKAPENLIHHPSFVPAAPLLSHVGEFDAGLFGFSPREAELLDPQQRLFLECTWESLERAGYDPARYREPIGVFAGTGVTSYAFENLRGEYSGSTGFEAMLANDKDYVASRIAYKLDLRGPAIAVQTACSTSLVALHLACQSLLAGECDMALAGGVSIRIPHIGGYIYQSGMISSPDGHCRAFDAAAAGTVAGSGAGVVVLKRLDDALEARDNILAVVRGSAVNNDGGLKAGFSAPSAATQAVVIREAIAVAGIEPKDVSYVEAHGTATPLGDPVELDALNEVFGPVSVRGERCALGSVKTNIGHADTAAGIAGVIKTVLALQHRQLPPSLHFERPNPEIRFGDGPFEVVNERRYWPSAGPRRAGVSSFGLGGTNAHAVLEEWTADTLKATPCGPLAVPLSARSKSALQILTARLSEWLDATPTTSFPSVALSLAAGRRQLNWRTFLVATSGRAAAESMRNGNLPVRVQETGKPPVTFLFSGQGAQYPGMARSLMSERIFRERVAELSAVCREETGEDPIPLLVDASPEDEAASTRLMQTRFAQPALFIVQEALARLLLTWGVIPSALLGHSVGEYTAAAIAGVFDACDALRLVCRRGAMMQTIAGGAMMAVQASERYLAERLSGGLSIAAVNGPEQCVVSGPEAEVAALDAKLRLEGLAPVRLRVSIAAHSSMMKPILGRFEKEVGRFARHAPRIPVISNVTGCVLTADQAVDTGYWAGQLCQPVRFADAAATVRSEPGHLFLEVGPGHVLAPLAGGTAFGTLPAAKDQKQTDECLAHTVGHLWLHGVPVDWEAYHRERGGSRVALPTYPFERQRYWIDAPSAPAASSARRPIEDWCYLPSWTPAPKGPAEPAGKSFLLLGSDTSFRAELARMLRARGAEVRCVADVRPADVARDAGELHCVVLTPLDGRAGQQAIDACYHTPLRLLRTIISAKARHRVTLVSRAMEPVLGGVCESPASAMLAGLVMAARQELQDIAVRSIDLGPQDDGAQLIAAMEAGCPEPAFAWRLGQAWIPAYRRVTLPETGSAAFRRNLVCVIVGGTGGIGLSLAERLAHSAQAKLALIVRSGFPDRSTWGKLEDDPVYGARIRRLRRIEAAGSDVLTVKADVADSVDLNAAIERVRSIFGPIHGAIHAAGIAGGGLLAVRNHAEADLVLRPKVLGAIGLAEALASETLDFLVFCGSLTATTGGFGHSDYIAGNAFVDRFAHHLQARGVRATAIDWDTWNESGMALSPSIPLELRKVWAPSLANGIRDEEGGIVLERVLGLSLPRVVVSTTPLEARLVASASDVADSLRQVEELRRGAPAHLRPDHLAPAQPAATELETRMCEMFSCNLGFAPVGVVDDYFECGGDSLKGVSLVSRLEAALGETVHVAALFEAPSPRQLALYLEQNYEQSVGRWLTGTVAAANRGEVGLKEADVEAFRRALPRCQVRRKRPAKKNRRIVFLLSPPRTGSTLLRAMLAGHPKIFAPPELALLGFNTFEERNAAVPEDGGLFEGPLQALRNALACDWEQARAEMESFGPSAFIGEFYARLQGLIGDRLLVDKSPHYVLDPEVLRRAEEDFESPLYLMLQRHPYGMIRSYVESRIDLLLSAKLRAGSEFSRRQIGELIWIEGYRNLREFSRMVPDHRQLWLQFEQLTADPRGVMHRVSDFLGIEFDERLLDPYSDEEKRMTGVLRAGSRPLGDIKFHRYSGVERSVAVRWRDEYKEDFLSDQAAALARSMGYRLIADEQEQADPRPVDQLTDAEVEAELARYVEQNA